MALITDITLGQFYPVSSFIHALDPRTKFISTILFVGGVLMSKDVLMTVILLCICFLAVRSSRVPITVFLRNLKPFRWLFLFTFLLNIWGTVGTHEFFSTTVLERALLLCGKLGLLIAFSSLLMFTTQPIDLSDGFRSLFSFSRKGKMAVSRFAFIVTLSLRFLPILIQEAQRLRNAQLARGLYLDGNLLSRIPKLVAMVGPLLTSALKRADLLAISMEARSFDISADRSSFLQLRWRGSDLVALSVVSAVFMLVLLRNL